MAMVKIYGERNTNTNYLSQLIALNLDAFEIPGTVPPYAMRAQRYLPGKEAVRDVYFKLTARRNLGWKHTYVDYNKISKHSLATKVSTYITITKNPYSWLLSLYRKPYHFRGASDLSFEAFLESEWKTIGRDNIGDQANPIELWNVKNRSYFSLGQDKSLLTTTEKILEDPEWIINQISEKGGINKRSNIFINFDQSTKEADKDNKYYRDYYLNERWKEDLTQKAIEIINRSLDAGLATHFGYNIL
ncbi:MAG: hypothetical protein AAGB26_06995 [Planctomycetota bacterium]